MKALILIAVVLTITTCFSPAEGHKRRHHRKHHDDIHNPGPGNPFRGPRGPQGPRGRPRPGGCPGPTPPVVFFGPPSPPAAHERDGEGPFFPQENCVRLCLNGPANGAPGSPPGSSTAPPPPAPISTITAVTGAESTPAANPESTDIVTTAIYTVT